MGSLSRRARRVASRVFHPFSQLHKAGKMAFGILGFIGVTALALWWERLTVWAKEDPVHWIAIVLAVLCVCVLSALYGMEKEAEEHRRKMREQNQLNRRVVERDALDMWLGPKSNATMEQRFNRATELLERFEKEIFLGDFGNSVKLLALEESMLDTLGKYFGGSTYGFEQWHDRLYKAVEAVRSYEEEEAKRLAREADND